MVLDSRFGRIGHAAFVNQPADPFACIQQNLGFIGVQVAEGTVHLLLDPGCRDETQVGVGGDGKTGRNPDAGLDHLAEAGVLAAHLGEGPPVHLFEI